MKKELTVFALVLTVFLFSTSFSSSFGQESQRILYIGDSHTVGTFGAQFAKELACAFCGQVTRYGITGSAVFHWMGASWPPTFANGCMKSVVSTNGNEAILKSSSKKRGDCVTANFPHFDKLLQDNFDAVVIALGTNDVVGYCPQTPAQQATAMGMVKQMIETAKRQAKTCVWVGPPHFEKNSSVIRACKSQDRYDWAINMLRQEVEKNCCIYVDSREFKMPPDKKDPSSFIPETLEDCRRSDAAEMYPDITTDPLHLHFDRLGKYWARCAALVVKGAIDKLKTEPLRKPDGTPCPSTPGSPAP